MVDGDVMRKRELGDCKKEGRKESSRVVYLREERDDGAGTKPSACCIRRSLGRGRQPVTVTATEKVTEEEVA
jgi:hypothetical protein